MAESTNGRPPGPNRHAALKIALIPVLGVLLYTVLPGDDGPALEVVRPTPGARPAVPASAPKPSVPILATVRPIEQIVEQDPFALPNPLAPAPLVPLVAESTDEIGVASAETTQATTAEAWETLRERWSSARTSIVLTTPEGPVAVVGERQLRIGDEVEPGVRVVDIRSEGVVLEVDESASGVAP